MKTGTVVDNLSIKTKIEILLKLAVVPDVNILAPKVSVKNGTVILGGIVDAYWKSAYIAKIVSSELPGRVVENNMTVAMACFLDGSCPTAHEKELQRAVVREESDHHYIAGDVL